MNLKEQRATLLDDAKRLADNAKSADRDLTPGELAVINSKLEQVADIDAKAERAKEGEALLRQLGGQPVDGSGTTHLGLTGRAGQQFVKHVAGMITASREPDGKAVTTGGQVIAPTPMVPEDVTALGGPAPTLLDVLPSRSTTGPNYIYLRQSVRTNAAAPVAQGAAKPTSVYSVVTVAGVLQVIAHLSEPVDKFVLADSTALTTWLSNELQYGLALALQDQICNGSGTAPNLRGLLNTSGVLVQSAVGTSALDTTRQALTKLEVQGAAAPVFAMNPNDWEAISLVRTSGTGALELGNAADDTAQKLWGSQVVLTTALAAKTALALDPSAATIVTDQQGVQVEWGTPGDLFTKNQVQARCEMRADLEVVRPFLVCKITLP